MLVQQDNGLERIHRASRKKQQDNGEQCLIIGNLQRFGGSRTLRSGSHMLCRVRTKQHQIWIGAPGKGKTALIHKHVKNSVGYDMFPDYRGKDLCSGLLGSHHAGQVVHPRVAAPSRFTALPERCYDWAGRELEVAADPVSRESGPPDYPMGHQVRS